MLEKKPPCNRPRLLKDQITRRWKIGLIGGLFTYGSYWLVLLAMMRVAIALVAALRETSVIFGAIMAALFLKERFSPTRYLAIALVAAGAIAMKLL